LAFSPALPHFHVPGHFLPQGAYTLLIPGFELAELGLQQPSLRFSSKQPAAANFTRRRNCPTCRAKRIAALNRILDNSHGADTAYARSGPPCCFGKSLRFAFLLGYPMKSILLVRLLPVLSSFAGKAFLSLTAALGSRFFRPPRGQDPCWLKKRVG
jgi:hypothetical protein